MLTILFDIGYRRTTETPTQIEHDWTRYFGAMHVLPDAPSIALRVNTLASLLLLSRPSQKENLKNDAYQ